MGKSIVKSSFAHCGSSPCLQVLPSKRFSCSEIYLRKDVGFIISLSYSLTVVNRVELSM